MTRSIQVSPARPGVGGSVDEPVSDSHSKRSSSEFVAGRHSRPDAELAEGTQIYHARHGPGRITEIDPQNERGRPYLVRFLTGEVHRYTASSARAKLHPGAVAKSGTALKPSSMIRRESMQRSPKAMTTYRP